VFFCAKGGTRRAQRTKNAGLLLATAPGAVTVPFFPFKDGETMTALKSRHDLDRTQDIQSDDQESPEDDPRDMPDVLSMLLTRRQKKAYRDRLYQRTPFCRFCGRKIAKREDATVDHLLPQSRGGLDTPANLALACGQCNEAKADRTPREWAIDVLCGASPRTEGGAS
jgi:hypothetical protein